MKIRFAKEEDKTSVKKLWSYSFQDSQSYVDYYFLNRYQKENNIIVEEADKMVSSLLINPYKLFHEKEEKSVSYIVGVSVSPEYRGLGYSSFLMKETLSLLQKRGDEMVLLMPIDTAIYRRYGFINTFFQHSFRMKLGHPVRKVKNIRFEKVDVKNHNHIETLLKLYEQEMRSKAAYMKRTSEDFVTRILEWAVEGASVYLIHQEDVIGYFMMLPSYGQETAMVQELVATKTDAILAVLNFLNHHQTQCKNAIINPVNERLFELAIEYNNKIEHTIQPFMMARVLNVEAVLQKLFTGFLKELEGKKLFVEDSILPDNHGMIECSNGVFEKSNSVQWDVKMSIEAITLLYMKQVDFVTLFQTDMIEATDEMKKILTGLDQFYKVGENYSNDYV